MSVGFLTFNHADTYIHMIKATRVPITDTSNHNPTCLPSVAKGFPLSEQDLIALRNVVWPGRSQVGIDYIAIKKLASFIK